MTDFNINVTAAGQTVSGVLTHTPAPAPPPPPPLRIGIDCSLADLPGDLTNYPNTAYHRIFSPDKWPWLDRGKMPLLPHDVLPHCSADGPWNPDEFEAWCQQLTRQVLVTWRHEPMKKATPDEYRRVGAELATIAAAHPLIVGNGPILTRYWLDEAGGNPDDYFYDGATFIGVDCYNGYDNRYRTPESMFGTAVDLGLRYGVPVLIPEWGVLRIPTDGDGQQRAQLLRDSVAYLRDNDVAAAGWWNIGGTRITPTQVHEMATLQTLVDQQP